VIKEELTTTKVFPFPPMHPDVDPPICVEVLELLDVCASKTGRFHAVGQFVVLNHV
jgi:hypothetical protein